jgi:hypothetical protein
LRQFEPTYSTRPAGTRSVGTQLSASNISPETRSVGTQLRSASISEPERVTSISEPERVSSKATKPELVNLIRAKGGRANMGMSKSELLSIASNL